MEIVFLLILISSFFVRKDENKQIIKTDNKEEVNKILLKTFDTLNHIKNIRFCQRRILSYPSEHYYVKQNGWCTISFGITNSPYFDFTYQISDSAQKQIFNGTEEFVLNKETKLIQINVQPDSKLVLIMLILRISSK